MVGLVAVGILYTLMVTLLHQKELFSHRLEIVSSHIQQGEPLLGTRAVDSGQRSSWISALRLTLWDSFQGLRQEIRSFDHDAVRIPIALPRTSFSSAPDENGALPNTTVITPKVRAPSRKVSSPIRNAAKDVSANSQTTTTTTMPIKEVTTTTQLSLQDGLHLVMVFPLLLTNAWLQQGYNDSSVDLLTKREREYVDCLRANLYVPTVASVHLFSDQPDQLREKLSTTYSLDLGKIYIHQSSSNPTYRDIFQYASNFLQGKLVFVMNADNFLGEGFDHVNITWWRTPPREMYALTRHSLPGRPASCTMGPAGYCDADGAYYGSHDGFLFLMNQTLPEKFLSELEFPSHVYGSENVVIWAFRTFLNFEVTNPCRRLVIYHNHCVEVRALDGHRTRVHNVGPLGISAFGS